MGCRRSCVTRKHAGQIRLRCSCKKTELIRHTFHSKHHFTKKKKNLDQLFFYRRKNNIFQIILLVYDVTNSFSFEVLEEWIDKIRKLSDNYEERPLMAVVGNKCDMEHQRTVKKDRTHKFAADNGFPSHDVSARTGEAVKYSLNNKRSNILYFLFKKKLVFISGFFVYSDLSRANFGCSIDENRSGLSQAHNNCRNRRHSGHEHHPQGREKDPHEKANSNTISSPFTWFKVVSLPATVKITVTKSGFCNTIFLSNVKDGSPVHKTSIRIFFATFLPYTRDYLYFEGPMQ